MLLHLHLWYWMIFHSYCLCIRSRLILNSPVNTYSPSQHLELYNFRCSFIHYCDLCWNYSVALLTLFTCHGVLNFISWQAIEDQRQFKYASGPNKHHCTECFQKFWSWIWARCNRSMGWLWEPRLSLRSCFCNFFFWFSGHEDWSESGFHIPCISPWCWRLFQCH